MRAALLFLGLIVCALTGTSPALAGSTLIKAREAEILAKHPNAARRDGCRLTLNLEMGKGTRFDDYSADCTSPPQWRWLKAHKVEWHHHYLDAYIPKCQLFVVMTRHNENDDYVLVDARNGRSTTIDGNIDLSPDCTHALEVTPENEAGDVHGLNVIRIWRRAGSKFVRSWERRLKWNFHPGFARWDGEDQVVLLCSLSTVGGEQFAIRRRAGGWQFDPAQKSACATQLLR